MNANHGSLSFSEKDLSQLFRYFTATDVRFGIWTNGLIYRFYSELKEPNRMDPDPFLEFRLDEPITDKIAANLEIFTKSKFDEKSAINEAKKLRYIDSIKQLLLKESDEPSDKFAAFIVKEFPDVRNSKQLREAFRPYIKEAFQAIINTRQSLESASRTSVSVTTRIPTSVTPKNSVDSGDWVSLSDYTYAKEKKPKKVRLWEESEINLKYAKDLLVEIAELLRKDNLLNSNTLTLPYRGKMGKKRYLINTTPVHPHWEKIHPSY